MGNAERNSKWFSRRHQTNEAHQAERDKRDARELAKEKRITESVKRSPAEQLRVLNERLGEGQGAKKERARLNKELAIKKAALAPAKAESAPPTPKIGANGRPLKFLAALAK